MITNQLIILVEQKQQRCILLDFDIKTGHKNASTTFLNHKKYQNFNLSKSHVWDKLLVCEKARLPEISFKPEKK